MQGRGGTGHGWKSTEVMKQTADMHLNVLGGTELPDSAYRVIPKLAGLRLFLLVWERWGVMVGEEHPKQIQVTWNTKIQQNIQVIWIFSEISKFWF